MKYVRQIGLVLIVLLFIGCGASTPKKITMVEETPELVATLDFIPQLQRDKEGNFVPYEAMENPYLAQKGKIKKDSVYIFIQAKREFNKKNYASAKKSLLKLVEIDSKLSGPWVMLGDIAKSESDNKKAIENYQKSLSINVNNVNAYLKLALVQRIQGDFIAAQNTYAKALAIWKDFPEAHLNLAILYDVYLNHPIRAQKHMEAYQFLTEEENEEVAKWLENIRSRTGIATQLRPVPALAEG